jgi:very-short-patch-repair endonuclease
LSFDFCLPDSKIIIELDGLQHFKQVRDWVSPEIRQAVDIYKMKCAIGQGYRIIRILQEDVKLNKFNWKNELFDAIDSNDKIVYICKNDEYNIYKHLMKTTSQT